MSHRVRRKKSGEEMILKEWAYVLILFSPIAIMLLSLVVNEKQPGWLMLLGVVLLACVMFWSGVKLWTEIQNGPNEFLKKERKLLDRISSLYYYLPFMRMARNTPLWLYRMNVVTCFIGGLLLLLIAFLMLMGLTGSPLTIRVP